MYSFLRLLLTNWWLKKRSIFYQGSGGQNPKSRYFQGHTSPGSSKGKSFLPFSNFWCFQAFLGSGCETPISGLSLQNVLCVCVISSSVSYKDACNWI